MSELLLDVNDMDEFQKFRVSTVSKEVRILSNDGLVPTLAEYTHDFFVPYDEATTIATRSAAKANEEHRRAQWTLRRLDGVYRSAIPYGIVNGRNLSTVADDGRVIVLDGMFEERLISAFPSDDIRSQVGIHSSSYHSISARVSRITLSKPMANLFRGAKQVEISLYNRLFWAEDSANTNVVNRCHRLNRNYLQAGLQAEIRYSTPTNDMLYYVPDFSMMGLNLSLPVEVPEAVTKVMAHYFQNIYSR